MSVWKSDKAIPFRSVESVSAGSIDWSGIPDPDNVVREYRSILLVLGLVGLLMLIRNDMFEPVSYRFEFKIATWLSASNPYRPRLVRVALD